MRSARRDNHSCCLFLISFVVAFLAVTTTGRAQVKSSTINIVVMDSAGARIPDVQAEVLEEATNQKFTGATNNVGELTVPYLPSGRYAVSLRKSGFRPYTQIGLQLGSSQTAMVAAMLEVGQTQQVMEVSASAVQLQTESSSVQGATTATTIDALPNINQNPLYYATLQAGVVPAKANFSSTTSAESFGIGYKARSNFSAISINGGESLATDIQLDGVPIMGADYNDAAVLPNAEGIQEVRVMVNNFTADNGRGQGVTSIITKSGANDFHGSANFRLRNEALNANTFENNYNHVARQPFKADYWGASLGGAIKKDKLFFFTSYEGLTHSVAEYWLMSVPTPAEKRGDFSKTLIADQNGNPIPAAIYNPFQVTQLGANLYQRATVPNSILANPSPYALKLFSYYADPNRAPTDVYNHNNYFNSAKKTFGKDSVNSRVDYRLGSKHSIYGAGGIMKGSINGPAPFGSDNPFWSYGNSWGSEFDRDSNPYASIGDTIVLSPTMVADIRFGVTRVVSDSGSKGHNLDFNSIGVPKSVQAIMPDGKQSPDFGPPGYSALGQTTWGHKKQRQLTHSVTGSLTKSLGHWTMKAGAEYRVSLSNYEDFAQGSISIDGIDGSEYLTSTGGGVVENKTPVQSGFSAASLFQGAGSFSLTPGFGVRPAFAAKYTALYSQNDWRVSSKLTVNLGLRWELQPAPTERYNRFSSFDDSAKSPFGTGLGAIAFPGVGGYDNHLWDTHYKDFGPRLGFAYSPNSSTVVRGGYGITYVPTNTGYAPGPSRYGEGPFTSSAVGNVYGVEHPNGMPVGTFDSGLTTQFIPQIGAQPTNQTLYGATSGFSLFSRHNYLDGRIQQFNLVVEKRLGSNWFLSVNFTGTRGSDLPNRTLLTSNQFIPGADLAAWRSSFIANNGANPANDQVQNPFQPATGELLPFSGALSGRTISRSTLAAGNPLLTTLSESISQGHSRYNSADFNVSHAFSSGLQMNAHYTWSKSMADYASDMFTNGGTDTGIDALANWGKDLKNMNNNWHLGFTDTPQRFVGTFIYELPFGKGKQLELKNRAARMLAGGWRVGGVEIIQSGMPLVVYGMNNSGSLNQRPNRVAGVSLQLPSAMQHFYDGKTTITLPSGRQVTPCNGCYMKFNPDAFSGNVVKIGDGSTVADPFWYGNAALTYNDVRGPGRFNTDLNLSRSFNLTEKKLLQFVANVSNAFNHTQYTVSGNLATGDVNTTDYPGQIQNFGQLGGHGLGTFEPRQVELKLRFMF